MKFFRVLITLLCLTQLSLGQQKIISSAQFNRLKELNKEFKEDYIINKNKALLIAKEKNWPIFRSYPDGTIMSLQGIDEIGLPIYLITYSNAIAANTTRTSSLYQGGSLGLSLSGASVSLENKIALWDGGSVLGTHQEFNTNRIAQKDNPANLSNHATHVAGTMAAAGINPNAKGMAFGLKKLIAYDFESDIAEMTNEAANGVLISNHSYGFLAGWDYDTQDKRWEWYGLPNSTEDYRFGAYNSSTRNWDIICYNAPYYLPVKSSGNNRAENGPGVGAEYFGYSNASPNVMVSLGPRPANISSNDGYDIISTTGTAKNILTVGAVNGLPFGSDNPTQITISNFSSWGPTDDGRIKPDIVADGVSVTSTGSTSNDAYATLSGTSMATPNVSGSLILLQEYYAQLKSGNFMRASSLKGLAIHTADEAGTTSGPDYIYGWGLLNIERAANHIKLNGIKTDILEKTLAQGEVYNHPVIASGYGPLKVTICWTDVEGTATPAGTLNDRTSKLVNDLDLRVIENSNTYLPWVLDPLNPSSAAKKSDNAVDNVEQITISNSTPGQKFNIRISHKGSITKGPQHYSLLISGIGGGEYCTQAANSKADGRIDKFKLNTINETLPNSCRSYTDFKSISTSLEIGKTYPLNITPGTCGVNKPKIIKVFVDWNLDGDFNDSQENISTSAIINNNEEFISNITVPSIAIEGTSTILRIVLSDTDNVANVTPCGNYDTGETQDYRLDFIKNSIDAGALAINNPENTLCPSEPFSLGVRLKNFGSSSINNIPVKVSIIQNNTVLETFTENFTGNLLPNHEVNFVLNKKITLAAGLDYSLEVKTDLNSDLISSNNAIIKNFKLPELPKPTNLFVAKCDNSPTYHQLNANGDGTVYWYAKQTDEVPIAVGQKTITDVLPTNNGYHAGINTLKVSLGPKSKYEYGGGTYSGNFGPKPEFTVAAAMVLDSALLYTSSAGQLTFTVETTSGTILNSVTIQVEKSKTNSNETNSAGQVVDDPNDKGKMYKLGLLFPGAGTYRIGISYNGATIYRSNSGVSNLPIKLGNNIISLNGAYFESSGATITDSYYYFYNMKIKAFGCTDNSKQFVAITKPVISQVSNTLVSSIKGSSQWYLNNNAINGATADSYIPTEPGVYTVEVKNPSGCASLSANFNYLLTSLTVSESSEIDLNIYPIPSKGLLNLNFQNKESQKLNLSIRNIVGQDVFEFNKNIKTGNIQQQLDLTNLKSGVYIMQIKLGDDKYYTQKFTIEK